MAIERKWGRLQGVLHEMDMAVLAYSGGVDSSVLLKAASEVMGPRLIAVTAISETYPSGELAQARDFVSALGVTHRIIRSDELTMEAFVQNSPERCYFCKRELFGKLRAIADEEGITFVLDGSNVDDLSDLRPGRRAAKELSVRSPLVEAGFTKKDIREIARKLHLPMWNKPSLACLSSRIPYGTRITSGLLRTVQSAEDAIRGLGIRQVRVRHHGETARIEVLRDDFNRLLSDGAQERITRLLKELGYTYVCLDLDGYRTGSMNEAAGDRQKTVDSRQ